MSSSKNAIETRDNVTFNGKSYVVRHVEVKGFGIEPVASKALENELLKGDKYVSEEARVIDEGIFFYVEDSVFNRYTYGELSDYVSRNVA